MSVADKLTQLRTDITNAYTAINSKGGTIPEHKNTSSLANAIESISAGGDQPQLYAPTITISGDELVITPNENNGTFVTSYDIYNDDTLIGNTTATTVILWNYITEEQINQIKVKAKATNFVDSNYSNAAQWNSRIGLGITSTGGNTVKVVVSGTLSGLYLWYRFGTTGEWTVWGSLTSGETSEITIPDGETLYIWNETENWGTYTASANLLKSSLSNPNLSIAELWEQSDKSLTLKEFEVANGINSARIAIGGTGTVALSGAINSLLNATTVTGKPCCFYNLFSSNTNITDISNLTFPTPDLTGANNCYANMFSSCSGLVNAGTVLPATTLSDYCYDSMFKSCSSLTTVPTINAVTLAIYCCNSMFQSCTSLTSIPSDYLSSAITLASGCYAHMFWSCTSLSSIMQRLPATTLVDACYGFMFANTAITTGVFFGKIQVPKTIPQYACYGMYKYCTNLKNPVGFTPTTIESNGCLEMFSGCSSLYVSKDYGPSGYMEFFEVPSNLGSDALTNMFYGCILENGATATPSAGDNLYRKVY